AEHMILAKPEVCCSSGSPGGGTYGVLSSSDFARAINASFDPSCGTASASANITPATNRMSPALILDAREWQHRRPYSPVERGHVSFEESFVLRPGGVQIFFDRLDQPD